MQTVSTPVAPLAYAPNTSRSRGPVPAMQAATTIPAKASAPLRDENLVRRLHDSVADHQVLSPVRGAVHAFAIVDELADDT